jgi:hypothetical protein
MCESGKPQTNPPKDEDNQIFFTRWFGVRVTPDYRTVVIVAKKGFKLAMDPSQTSEQKIVVTSLVEKNPK